MPSVVSMSDGDPCSECEVIPSAPNSVDDMLRGGCIMHALIEAVKCVLGITYLCGGVIRASVTRPPDP